VDELPMVRKLRQFMELTKVELGSLNALGADVRRAGARAEISSEGGASGTAILLHEGWAMRQRTLRDGRRQIIDFLVPGDLCDPCSFVSGRRDFTVSAISPVAYSPLQPEQLLTLLSSSPRVGAFLWWLESRESFFLRAHLVAVGRMRADERIAYLIWELWVRLQLVGMAQGHTFELPATQDLLADATGLTHVHVSRTMRRLQKDGIIERTDRTYRITNPDKLLALAQVDESLYVGQLPGFIRDLLRSA
jgi:CRP-like cAMP-binding protein